MRRYLWLSAVMIVVLAGVGFFTLGRGLGIDRGALRASEEYEAGLEAIRSYYYDEARMHMELATEFDPDFIPPRMLLSNLIAVREPDRSVRLLEDVLASDLSHLGDRDRFLVRHALAVRQGHREEASAVVEEHLRRHPDDPWALSAGARGAWSAGDIDTAEAMFTRLLEVDPGWIAAYNGLGYLAMMRQDFTAAEERFTSSRFVKPGQANPHDSLGELYALTGLYDEATASFEEAIAIKPEFWDSYFHLVHLLLHRGQVESAHVVFQAALERSDCPNDCLRDLRCLSSCGQPAAVEAWSELLDGSPVDCVEGLHAAGLPCLWAHRAACELGRWGRALELEKLVEEQSADGAHPALGWALRASPMLKFMRGFRLARQGELEEAADLLRRADGELVFSNMVVGFLKLETRVELARVLEAAGRDEEARQVRDDLRAVNPHFAGR
jgi:tetratricopeptide (TPR) repeat protein